MNRQRSILADMLLHRFSFRILILSIALVGSLVGLASPFFQKIFMDTLAGPSALPLSAPQAITAAFFALILSQALNSITLYLGSREAALFQQRIADRVYARILTMRTDEIGARASGEFVSYYAVDVPGMSEWIQSTLPMGASILFPLILGPIAVHVMFGVPLLWTLTIIFAVAAINVYLASRQARLFMEFKKLSADRAGLVNEWVQIIRALRQMDWISQFETRIFDRRERETRKRISMVSNGQFMGAFSSSITFILNLVTVGMLLWVRGSASVSPGEILALLWIVAIFLFRPFRMLPWIFTFALDAWTSIQRVEAFLAQPIREVGSP
ncbi:MAG: ABC transporter transmembrane domain-containing protein, partial [Bdellovibrionota bacterium]